MPTAVFLIHGAFHVGYTIITAVAKDWAIDQNNQRIAVGFELHPDSQRQTSDMH